MEIGKHWTTIREIFEEAYKSCLHFAVASVNEDGSPHVTPIGALFLRENRTGFYFEEYPSKMPENLKRYTRVCKFYSDVRLDTSLQTLLEMIKDRKKSRQISAI